jgi:hypothetical protein
LQNAIVKHGLENFAFYVLELLSEDSSSYEDLLELEPKYLDLFENKYNFLEFASRSRAGTPTSEETKLLLSKVTKGSHSEERKKQISEQFSKSLFLYNAQPLNLIKEYSRQGEFIEEFKVSPKILLKFRDSGLIFRDKYILTSKRGGGSEVRACRSLARRLLK